MLRTTILAALLIAAAPLATAQFQPVTCANAFTPQQEIEAGNKVVAEVYKQMPVLPDSDPVSRYIQQLGARLVSAAPSTPGLQQQWPFRFHVVASEEINAFALPGGTMFVNLGAIQAAETEAQLAGIMSHEMSHVIMRHSTCNLTRQRKRSIWYGLGAIGSEIALGGTGGALAAKGIGMAESLDFLHMSRGDEQQADLLGVHIAHDAGFDPRGLAQFFEIIQAKYGSGGAQFLSDHPNPGNRTEYVNREIALLAPLERPIKSSPDFTRIHQLAIGEHALTAKEMQGGAWKTSGLYSTAPGQPAGVIPPRTPASAPSNPGPGPGPRVAPLSVAQLGLRDPLVKQQFSNFSLRAPSSWQHSVSTQGTVTLAPRGGSGSFGLAYGVLLGVVQQGGDGISDETALRSASDTLASQLVQANGLTPAGSLAMLQVGGQPATARDLRGVSPIGTSDRTQPEHDWLVTVARPDGDLDYLIFVAPESDFATLRPLFQSMLSSFRAQ